MWRTRMAEQAVVAVTAERAATLAAEAASAEAGTSAEVAATGATTVVGMAVDGVGITARAVTAGDSVLDSGWACISLRCRFITRPIGGAAFPITTLMTLSTPGTDRPVSTKRLTRLLR